MDFRFKHYNSEGKQIHGTRNMKNINFVPENIQGILSSHKILEKCNERHVSL